MQIDSRDLCLRNFKCVEKRLGGRDAIDGAARATGALKRRREIRHGSDLLRLAMHYGAAHSSLRRSADWAEGALGIEISNVAVLGRLRGAGDFLAELVSRALSSDGLPRWKGPEIRLVDGSMFCGPGAEGFQHRLHAAYDPMRGRFSRFELTDKHVGEKLTRADLEAGVIAVGDRNFARTAALREVVEKEAFFVVRAGVHTTRMLDSKTGERIGAARILEALGDKDIVELKVRLIEAKGEKKAPLAARLIVQRASKGAARREQRRIKRSRVKHGAEPLDDTLALAGVRLILTNLPGRTWRPQRVLQLYRLRWQIELAFKMLKSVFDMRHVPANDPGLARSWILANLLAAILARQMSALLESAIFPGKATREDIDTEPPETLPRRDRGNHHRKQGRDRLAMHEKPFPQRLVQHAAQAR